jgi:hypothetical protein
MWVCSCTLKTHISRTVVENADDCMHNVKCDFENV